MRIKLENMEIPVTFLSSDHKMIPRLIQVLQTRKMTGGPGTVFDLEQLERIEVVGNEAYLYSKASPTSDRVCLALHG
ncbi:MULTISPECIES: hypothetical protein [unclassified Paenibacillus]|uniref:hypothetical protein n=1 Tax=unclassified Paenibacillus TaxID=185978 RepID=UPI0036325D04